MSQGGFDANAIIIIRLNKAAYGSVTVTIIKRGKSRLKLKQSRIE
jgi:hypothetical protein